MSERSCVWFLRRINAFSCWIDMILPHALLCNWIQQLCCLWQGWGCWGQCPAHTGQDIMLFARQEIKTDIAHQQTQMEAADFSCIFCKCAKIVPLGIHQLVTGAVPILQPQLQLWIFYGWIRYKYPFKGPVTSCCTSNCCICGKEMVI